MLKALVNEARLRLDITTTGPLLIKSGYPTVIGADMTPVLTYRNNQQEVYLPGSSLKGVFRSSIEKVINSIRLGTACNPVATTEEAMKKDNRHLYRVSCGSDFAKKARADEPLPAHKVYADSCPACRLFGSTSFAGRIAIEDAYLPEGAAEARTLVEHRDGIAIDRLTGGTGGGAKFDLNVVPEGMTFTTDIYLRNFEIWQLGMLFVIIQDMEDGLLRIGSGRSRGLGKVKGSISEQKVGSHPGGVVLSTMRTSENSPYKEPDDELWGIGHWLDKHNSKENELYKTRRDDLLTLSPPMKHEPQPRSVHNIRVFKGDALNNLKEKCIIAFVTQIEQWEQQETPVTQATPANAQQER